MNPKLIVVFTLEGMESHTINADTEQEQARMERLLSRIKPCLDVADAILKRGDLGPADDFVDGSTSPYS